MPFVDINSISPKTSQNDSNNDLDNDTPGVQQVQRDDGVTEIKGPPVQGGSVNQDNSNTNQQEQSSNSLGQNEQQVNMVNNQQDLSKNNGNKSVEDTSEDKDTSGGDSLPSLDFSGEESGNHNVNNDTHSAQSTIVENSPIISNKVSSQDEPNKVGGLPPLGDMADNSNTLDKDSQTNQSELSDSLVSHDFTSVDDKSESKSLNNQSIQDNKPLPFDNSAPAQNNVDKEQVKVTDSVVGHDFTSANDKTESKSLNNQSIQDNKPLPFDNSAPAQNNADKEQANVSNENESLSNLKSVNHNLDDYLQKSIDMDASDLHISSGYRVFVRINGEMSPLPSKVLTPEDTEMFAMQMFDYKGVSKKDKETLMDFDMAYQIKSGYRFRVNIFRQRETYALVFRLIPNEIKSLDELGMPSVLLEFAKKPYGLVLVTGPTGSGKSTTLAALLNYINQTAAKHIITIEDPIEYLYPVGKAKVNQRELMQDTESWSKALKSALRQDPDVVLVGEMRDYETIASAIRIAETGHLVFATLHTNTAAQTIDRIIDVFPDSQQSQVRIQLANTLQAVVTQRLVPNASGNGRVPANEILVATDAVRASIRENKVHQLNNIIQTSADVGMMTIEQSLVNLVRNGVISTEVAQEFTSRPEEILALLSRT